MPISHKHKFIFIHIPKNGGTSFERFFNLENRKNMHEGKDSIVENGVRYSLQHLTARQLKLHKETKDYFDTYFKFAIVRNPYERVISEFLWLQKLGVISKNNKPYFFKEWFNKFYKKIDKDHKLTQYDYIYDHNGKNLVDFVGRLETIDEDFKIILNEINYKEKKAVLGKKNVTNAKNDIFNYFIDEEINDRIKLLFDIDFKTFNYNKK